MTLCPACHRPVQQGDHEHVHYILNGRVQWFPVVREDGTGVCADCGQLLTRPLASWRLDDPERHWVALHPRCWTATTYGHVR